MIVVLKIKAWLIKREADLLMEKFKNDPPKSIREIMLRGVGKRVKTTEEIYGRNIKN